MPDLQQKRMVEFAHGIGMPVATHEIYPGGARRRRQHRAHRRHEPARLLAEETTLQRAYADVVQLFGKSAALLVPDDVGRRACAASSRPIRRCARTRASRSIPSGCSSRCATRRAAARPGGGADSPGNNQMLMDLFKAGGKVVAGTDTPNAVNLHGELNALRERRDDAVPGAARRDGDAGRGARISTPAVIDAGKLADIVLVEGNPLERIGDALKVRRVIANGRVHDVADLVKGATR